VSRAAGRIRMTDLADGDIIANDPDSLRLQRRRAWAAAWRARNREKLRARQEAWRERNPERALAVHKA
jgi:hypothetical protein